MFPPPEITFKMLKTQPFCLLLYKHHPIFKFQLLVELLQLHTEVELELLADIPSKVHLNFDQDHIYILIDVHFTNICPAIQENINTNEKNKL